MSVCLFLSIMNQLFLTFDLICIYKCAPLAFTLIHVPNTNTRTLTFKLSAGLGFSAHGYVSNFQVTLALASFAFEMRVYKT